MSRFGLYMILLGPLLVLLRPSAARCVDAEELHRRQQRLLRTSWNHPSLAHLTTSQPEPTCEQVAKELHEDPQRRSLSPWRYRLDRNVSRYPHEIPFAVCLCDGCLINRREDQSYNSRPVSVTLTVLMKYSCPEDPNRYLVRKDFISVPVACICVRPAVNNPH